MHQVSQNVSAACCFKVAKSCCSLLGGAVQPTHTLHHSSMTTGAPFLVHTSMCSHCCQDSHAPSLSKCLCCLLLQSCQVLLQPVGGCGAAHTHLASQLLPSWAGFQSRHIIVKVLLRGFRCTVLFAQQLPKLVPKDGLCRLQPCL